MNERISRRQWKMKTFRCLQSTCHKRGIGVVFERMHTFQLGDFSIWTIAPTNSQNVSLNVLNKIRTQMYEMENEWNER